LTCGDTKREGYLTLDERLTKIEVDLYQRDNALRKTLRVIAEKTVFTLMGIVINYIIRGIT
jgi:hypothetical protein